MTQDRRAVWRHHIDQHLDARRVVRDLSDLIAIPSVNPFGQPLSSGQGEQAVAQAWRAKMHAIGLETGLQDVVAGRPNVWGRLKGASPGPTVMLAGHLDTVGVEGYQDTDAFSGRVEHGRVYGRGACDMKAALAAFLETARVLNASAHTLAGDVLLVGLSDEEHAMLGSRHFSQSCQCADFAIVGEPTRLAVCPAHKGQQTFFIRTFGKAVHSSRPEQGENAIVRMARVIAALEGYGDALKSARQHPLCGYGRFSPGVIHGGTIASSVPDACELEIDRRFLPGETEAGILAELHERISPLSNTDPGFRYEIVRTQVKVAALDTPLDCPVVQSLRQARSFLFGETADVQAFPAGTDAPNLGCPAVICGPGDIAQAHTVNEFVEIEQIVNAVRLYSHALFHLLETPARHAPDSAP